jgi:hypothetical protein
MITINEAPMKACGVGYNWRSMRGMLRAEFGRVLISPNKIAGFLRFLVAT